MNHLDNELRMFMDSTWIIYYDAKFDHKLLEHQVSLKIMASKIAFRKWLDYKYPKNR